ncbi:MAG: DUF3180 family protein, partial [Actinobacteria bacterium]|nr:DUF3180 family protein [Actinomycetota bacterium]
MQRTPILSVIAFAVAGVAIGLLLQLMRSAQGSAPLVPPITLAATLLVIAAVLLVLAILLHGAVSGGAVSGGAVSGGAVSNGAGSRGAGSSGAASRSSDRRRAKKPVNPFHAVRLLAGARAGQFAGALFAGFGGGSLLQLLTRSVMAPAETWVPMMLVLTSGVILLICGIIAEM